MAQLHLHELVDRHREEIIRRCETASGQAEGSWMNQGAHAFLDQLIIGLRDFPPVTEGKVGAAPVADSPSHPCTSVGGSVVDLADELKVPISVEDALRLDRCLDAAIAQAITRHVRRQCDVSGVAGSKLQELTHTAISAFEVLQTGAVGVTGKTGTLVHRSLMDIRAHLEYAS